jgi:replication factor A1
MKVNELKPFGKKIDLVVKALSKAETREVTSKLDNTTHKVTEAKVADDTGAVLLTLWDDAIENVQDGKVYKITNAYTSLFKNSLRVNIGRYGQIEESTDSLDQVNEENNISEKELSQ